MTDDNSLTKHLMNVKEQVLRFAADKIHTHKASDITDGENVFAIKKHDSTSTTYGVASKTNYGHVKVDDAVNNSSNNPVQNKAIKSAIDSSINNLRTELNDNLQQKIIFVTDNIDEWENDTIIDYDGKTKYAVPTAKLVWDTIQSYDDLFVGVSLDKPKRVKNDIDDLIDAGYYKEVNEEVRYLNYDNELVSYKEGLIKVEVVDDRVVQHVYATEAVQSGNNVYYKLNGCEYVRHGVGEVTTNTDGYVSRVRWLNGGWQAYHIPYRSIAPIPDGGTGQGVDDGSIKVHENTAGYIFKWDQNATEDSRYTVHAPLYEYTKICEFATPLHINGSFIFGNVIGKMDVKITSTGMYVRTNVQPGGYIKGVHETFFVPRTY